MNENLSRKDLELAIQKTRDSFDTDKPVVPFIEGDGICLLYTSDAADD